MTWMGQPCSSITKKSRWFFGPGTPGCDLTEAYERCHHFHTLSSSPQLVPGSMRVCLVRKGDRRCFMATYQLNVNGQRKRVNVDPSTPLLWVLREELKMTGTKYGCGISACGA